MRKFKYDGPFYIAEKQASGHLTVKNSRVTLNMLTRGRDHVPFEAGDLHGVLEGGKKASLLNCIGRGSATHLIKENEVWQNATYEPSFFVIGKKHIDSEFEEVHGIEFSFTNAECLVGFSDAIGSERPDPEKLREFLEACAKKDREILREHGNEFPERPVPEIGTYPEIAYATGVFDLLSAACDIGELKLSYRRTGMSANAKGVRMKNRLYCRINFNAAASVEGSIRHLHQALLFFELILGRAQRIRSINLIVESAEEGEQEEYLDLIWCTSDRKNINSPKSTHAIDILIDPVNRPEEFSIVFSTWMDTMPDMEEARQRFSRCLRKASKFGPGRLIASANVFDLLPQRLLPRPSPTLGKLSDLLSKFKSEVKGLPKTDRRDAVLLALGFVAKVSLRDKINFRAEGIKKEFPKLVDVDVAIKSAVRCRNRYVHGSEGEFKYEKDIPLFAFLTETLEFIFAASDLIDLGWDIGAWSSPGTVQSHPFGAYLVSYGGYMDLLREKLED